MQPAASLATILFWLAGAEALARQQSAGAHPVGALQPRAAPAPVPVLPPVPASGALVAQPSDGLSQAVQRSQGELTEDYWKRDAVLT